MGRSTLRIEVTKKDQRALKKFLSGGVQPVRAVLRGMALLQLGKGVSAPRIIAMVCADPPQGHARWTVRLVAAQAVKRRLVPRVGRETIRVLLLSHDLKPWRKKMWWCAEMNRYGVEDARASRERSSDLLGPEFCTGRCEVSSEA